MSEDFFSQTFLGNPVSSYCWFLAILLTAFIFKKFIAIRLSRLLFRIFKKYSEGVTAESLISLLSRPIKLFVLVLSFYLAFDRLEFPGEWNLVPEGQFGIRMVLIKTFHTLVVFSLTWTVLRIIDFLALVFEHRAIITDTHTGDKFIPLIKEGTKIVVGIFGVFILLGSLFNVTVTSLLAGLGIGGLAVAYAAKETLENLIGSFTIFIDKPYTLGDLVKVGNITGTVEHIGFRSTRMRTAEKTLVTVPNKKMVDAGSENLTMRTARRAEFTIHLSYFTNRGQVELIIQQIQALILSYKETDKNDLTVRFASFGESSLDIYIEYFTHTPTIADYMKVKENINFGIMEIIARNGSTFAFPTTTVHVERPDTSSSKG